MIDVSLPGVWFRFQKNRRAWLSVRGPSCPHSSQEPYKHLSPLGPSFTVWVGQAPQRLSGAAKVEKPRPDAP